MSGELTLKEYQEAIDKWVSQFEEGYFPPFRILAKMIEELGEVAEVLNFKYGTLKPKPGQKISSLGSELADLLFGIVCLANSHDIDLSEEIIKQLDKTTNRDDKRFTKKDNQDRTNP